ncbi:MAG TPA: NADH-quinone oxidoreductase subunit A [Demequina sp.]|nr:NADH-quinone oxidoreductase subunit A [Demequina sp.]
MPGVVFMLGVGLVGLALVYGLSMLLSVDRRSIVSLPYLSGWDPEQHALSRYHARWYTATVVFLAFDIEMLFMYPWAVVVATIGLKAVIEMFLFLGVLLAGVFWAWREGAFRWV